MEERECSNKSGTYSRPQTADDVFANYIYKKIKQAEKEVESEETDETGTIIK